MKKNLRMVMVFAVLAATFCKTGFAQNDGSDVQEENSSPQNVQAEEKKEKYLFGTVELPLNEYKPSDFTRIVNGKEISIAHLISTLGIVLVVRQDLTKDDLLMLEESYFLKKERELFFNGILFSFTQDMSLGNVLTYLNNFNGSNEEWNSIVAKALPVFLFADEPRYTNGEIIIEWSPGVKKEYAEEMVKRLRLEPASFDAQTHVMIALPTNESGYNVFALSQAFGPQSGNAYVLLVEPRYASLDIPLTVTARVEPADGKGHGGDIAGSVFRYVLEITALPRVSVSLNELHVTSDQLKKWLPKNAEREKKDEVSPQVFDLEGYEEVSTANEADGKKRTTVVYRFRMSQSGEFTLASPRVYYDFSDAQLKKTLTETVEGMPVRFRVSPTMPSDASMVNDGTGMLRFTLQNPFPAGASWHVAASYSFSGAALLAVGVFLWIVFAQLRASGAKELGAKERARLAWNQAKSDLQRMLAENPEAFPAEFAERARAVLGLYATGDEAYFAAHTNIANAWPGPLDRDVLAELQISFKNFSAAPVFDPAYVCGLEEAETIMQDFDRLIGLIEEAP